MILSTLFKNNEPASYVPQWHIPMMNDLPRNEAYLKALEANVTKATHVLEIGTGSGLLAMIAARCGAKRKVLTCEVVPTVAKMARKIIRDNGYEDLVSVLNKRSTEIEIGVDMPCKADVIVSEILSNEFLGEGVLETIEDARSRLLAPGGIMIPDSGAIMFNLVGGDIFTKEYFIQDMFGFDLSSFNDIISRKTSFTGSNSFKNMAKLEFFSNDIKAFSFEFNNHQQFLPEKVILKVPIKRAGICSGIMQWIQLHLTKRLNSKIIQKNNSDCPRGGNLRFSFSIDRCD